MAVDSASGQVRWTAALGEEFASLEALRGFRRAYDARPSVQKALAVETAAAA
jgi:hypothetical protein